MRIYGPPAERFWARVVRTPTCWLWTGPTNGHYGHFSVKGRPISAHRFAYQLLVGSIPKGGLICHRCDNTLCVRPAHLFLSTHAGNTADMYRKGRDNHRKLSGQDIIEIRTLAEQPGFRAYGTGDVLKLGRRFSVGRQTIYNVLNHRHKIL